MGAVRLAFAGVIALPIMWLGSAFISETWNTYTHRFRLTLEVDTPEGVKSGSSVTKVGISEKATWVPQTGGISPGVRGGAVFVDLGSGRNLVGLLGLGSRGERDIYDLVARALGRNRPLWYREAPKWQGRAELTGELIPTLVTFSDLNDPKTARLISPNELAAVFGPGIRFRTAWIETTREGVTSGIRSMLPWLPHPRYFSGREGCGPKEPHCLHGGHFLKG